MTVSGWKGEEGHKKEKEAVKAEAEAERSESGNLGEKSVQRRQAGLEQRKNGGGDRRQLKKAAGEGPENKLALLGCFMLAGHKSCVCTCAHDTCMWGPEVLERMVSTILSFPQPL